MKIKLVIFDWSGVISDDRKPVYAAAESILKKHNKKVAPYDEFMKNATMTPVEFYQSHGIVSGAAEIYEMYKEHFSLIAKSGIVPQIYPDVHDVLKEMKNRQKILAVLSSHPTENLKAEAEQYDVKQFLDIIAGNSLNKMDGLEVILLKLNEKSKNALYVGDTIYDIRAAKKAGVNSAGICTGYHSKEMLEKEKPDILLNNLSQLKEIVK